MNSEPPKFSPPANIRPLAACLGYGGAVTLFIHLLLIVGGVFPPRHLQASSLGVALFGINMAAWFLIYRVIFVSRSLPALILALFGKLLSLALILLTISSLLGASLLTFLTGLVGPLMLGSLFYGIKSHSTKILALDSLKKPVPD